MYVADIGEKLSKRSAPSPRAPTSDGTSGKAALSSSSRQLEPHPRSEAGMTWPVVEYDHTDPLLVAPAITGVLSSIAR